MENNISPILKEMQARREEFLQSAKYLEAERKSDFKALYQKMAQAAAAQQSQKVREKATAEKEARDKKERMQRINELYSLIASLKQKLVASGYDKSIAAEIAVLQHELFWLMLQI